MAKKLNKGQQTAEDVKALLRARNMLWIVTREEARVEPYLFEAAAAAGYVPRAWDVAQGFTSMDGKKESGSILANMQDPGSALEAIRLRAEGNEPGAWIMRDLPAWLSGPAFATTVRQLRNLARLLHRTPPQSAQAIIILTPIAEVPPELTEHAIVINWPMPDRAEIAEILDTAIEGLSELDRNGKPLREPATPKGADRDAVIDAALGLSGEEAQASFARSLVLLRRIDPTLVHNEKRRIIARERVLEWIDPLPGGFDSVGGLDQIKEWILTRRMAYSADAREYGLPAPRGILLLGISGCGKSLIAKAISTTFNDPLLKMDLGALKSKFVGESEGNLRKAQQTIEAVGRCVVLLDEIEKSLAGATQGAADGGVAADALGAMLSWMQDRQGEAFIVATSNDISNLPPELLRKGRFDEIWWVDLPNQQERVEILGAALRQHGRGKVEIDRNLVASECDGFNGAEIAAIVPDALFTAFADGGREITTSDLLAAAETVTPLSETAGEKIAKMREWAKGKARFATSTTKPTLRAVRGKQGRVVDL